MANLKKYTNKSLILNIIIGGLIGYVILHPTSMVIHSMFDKENSQLIMILKKTFSINHVAMSIYFTFLGVIMGTFYGIYIQKINVLTISLQSLTITDELTSCYNRRFLYKKIEEEIKRANRYSRTFSLIMLDIDHFKTYNDRNGHINGDKLLKIFSELLRNIVREPDIVARYGGDEFCIIVHEANKNQAYNFCERILRNVTRHNFPGTEILPDGILTASLGVAEFSKEIKSVDDLIKKADNALYVSKNNGRNMISYFEALQGKAINFA